MKTETRLADYREELYRLRIQHVILRQLVIDQLAINRGISRNQAEAMVDKELFKQMQREVRP